MLYDRDNISNNRNKSNKSDKSLKGEKPLIISAVRLLNQDFPEPEFIVEDILPEGSLSMLSARPKAGKTFLALQLGISVALGRDFLFKKVKKQPVLFLSYELNERQVKKRFSLILERMGYDLNEVKQWNWQKFPFFLSFAGRLKGVDVLREYLDRFEERYGLRFGVIFIDTYVLFKDLDSVSSKSAYELESEYLAELRRLCTEKNIAIVLVYHNRKRQAVSGDITEEIMGSTGITGAVNNLLILDRKTGEREAHLKITGHDIEEQDIELTFDKGYFKIRTVSDREQEIVSNIRQFIEQAGETNQSRIIQYLKKKGYKSVEEITEILDKYSDSNQDNPTYWYVRTQKRDMGGRPLKLYSLVKQESISDSEIKRDEDVNRERISLLNRVEDLIRDKIIFADEFPELLEVDGYVISNFLSLVEFVDKIPLNTLKDYVERLERYRPVIDFADEDYEFDF
jgi:RecA-family ATPase